MSRQFTEANKDGIHGHNALSRALEKQGSFHYFAVSPLIPSGITSGRKAVTTAGSRETLVASSTPCLWVDVSADLGNTNIVVVGGIGVVAALDSQAGIVITPGNPPARIYIDDVQKLYVDSVTNGDAVTFNYATP